MAEIQTLIQHLNNYKDAIIFVGEDATRSLNLFKFSDKNKNSYSRKQLVKNSLEFWTYYLETIFDNSYEQTKEQSKIETLISTNIAKTVIDLNIDGNMRKIKGADYIPLCGQKDKFTCSKCNDSLSISKKKLAYEIKTKMKNENKYKEVPLKINPLLHKDITGEDCDGRIVPTIPFYGNKMYDINLIEKIGNSIFVTENNNFVGLNTHTLIFVGVDFSDSYIQNILYNFDLFKWRNQEEPAYKVFITERNESDLDIYKADFGTSDTIYESLDRLINLIIQK